MTFQGPKGTTSNWATSASIPELQDTIFRATPSGRTMMTTRTCTWSTTTALMYMDVRTDTDIQDMGATESILDIGAAPSDGWSPTHDVQLRVGHTYVVWTWDDHFAKFRVHSLSQSRVVFDWAYQTKPSTKLLKRSPGEPRPPLSNNRAY